MLTSTETSKAHLAPDRGKLNTAEIIIDRLIAWDVTIIFGIIGDGINPIIEALRKRKDEIKFVTVRHEEAAAFIACGYAKATGKPAACIGTSGPGAVNLMTGLYDAMMDGAPVIAITRAPFHDLLGTYYTQEVDTVSLMKDVAVYNSMITGPRNARTVVDLACRTAITLRGVVHLSVSKDIQQQSLRDDEPSKNNDQLLGSSVSMSRIDVPVAAELAMAASIINAGKKIMILAGRGAIAAGKEVEQLAALLDAPVTKALLGKSVLPDDSPFTTGGIGHLGTLPSQQMMEDCDTLLILGSNMPWINFYPKPGQAKIIQIDRDPKRLGLRCAIDIGLHGDVQATLKSLLPLLQRKNSGFLELAQKRMETWRKTLAGTESATAYPIRPQYLAATVGKLINDDAIISIDTGAHTVFTARHLAVKKDQQVLVSGNLASMGPGLPYAIAAQLAFPGRQCIAMVGDGGFTMLMAEMTTAVRYNLPVKIIIFKNNSLSMDKFEQEQLGNEEYGANLSPIDFIKVAEACGAEGYKCNDPAELPATLKMAFASARPTVVEVLTDPGQMPVEPKKM